MVLGSASVVGEVSTGSVLVLVSATAVVLGSVTTVVKAGPVVGLVSPTTIVLGPVSAVGEVKIGSQAGIGSSVVVIKGISLVVIGGSSLSLVSPLPLFERDLTITTATTTINITAFVTITTNAVVVVFMEEVTVVVVVMVVDIVEVVASFAEEVMVFVVVVVAVVVEVDVHDIDPEDPVNMLSFFALECTQESPQSICSNDVALLNIQLMSVTADTSHEDRSWLKDCA